MSAPTYPFRVQHTHSVDQGNDEYEDIELYVKRNEDGCFIALRKLGEWGDHIPPEREIHLRLNEFQALIVYLTNGEEDIERAAEERPA